MHDCPKPDTYLMGKVPRASEVLASRMVCSGVPSRVPCLLLASHCMHDVLYWCVLGGFSKEEWTCGQTLGKAASESTSY